MSKCWYLGYRPEITDYITQLSAVYRLIIVKITPELKVDLFARGYLKGCNYKYWGLILKFKRL